MELARIVSKCLCHSPITPCHLSCPSFCLAVPSYPSSSKSPCLSFLSSFLSTSSSFHLPACLLHSLVPLVFLFLVFAFNRGRIWSFCCVFSRRTHTLVHTNGKQIAGPVKWKKIDYLYLVTEHTHACACSEGGGGRTLGRCIEPSQGERK